MTALRLDKFDQILEEIVAPDARSIDEDSVFPRRSLDGLASIGLFGLMIPKEMGGAGGTGSELMQVCRKLGAVCSSTAMAYVMHVTSVSALIHQATTKQRERYLTPVVEGRWLVTEAISEPGSGSQWWSLASTSQTHSDGRFRLNAKKSFVTSAGYADLYMVSTRAPDSSNPRHHALFAVDADSDGVDYGPWKALGLRGSSSGPMTFELDVDADALIFGTGDDGLRVYNEANQPLYHLGIGSVYLGIAEAAIAATLSRIRSRVYAENASGHGKQLSDFPIARRHLGDMEIKRFALASATEKLACLIDSDVVFDELAVPMTALKVLAAETASSVAIQALQASGGMAYSQAPMTIERHVRDSLAGSLMGPNDDFCKELIGRLQLGDGDYHALGQ